MFFVFGLSTIALFLPENITKRFNLFDLIERYKTYLAIALIFSLLYYLYKGLEVLKDKAHSFTHKRIIKKHVEKDLNREEKELIISQYYNFATKEFLSKAELQINDGTVAVLLQKTILYQPSQLSLRYTICSLTLNNIARLHLNYLVSINKIVIKGNSERFEYHW